MAKKANKVGNLVNVVFHTFCDLEEERGLCMYVYVLEYVG